MSQKRYIVAAKLKTLPSKLKEEILESSSDKNPPDILSRYRELWRIEEVFRISKYDLKMRPIYHVFQGLFF